MTSEQLNELWGTIARRVSWSLPTHRLSIFLEIPDVEKNRWRELRLRGVRSLTFRNMEPQLPVWDYAELTSVEVTHRPDGCLVRCEFWSGVSELHVECSQLDLLVTDALPQRVTSSG